MTAFLLFANVLIASMAVEHEHHGTDDYLAALAQNRGARVATFDRGLAARRPAACELQTD